MSVRPLGVNNTLNETVLFTYDEYAQFVEWSENDERPIEDVLTFLNSYQQQLIDGNLTYGSHDKVDDVDMDYMLEFV